MKKVSKGLFYFLIPYFLFLIPYYFFFIFLIELTVNNYSPLSVLKVSLKSF